MDYPQIIAFFDEYNEHYRTFLKFEYSKMNMINKGEIEQLTQSLSKEQAFIMKSNTLEAKRISLMGNNITFAELISGTPDEYRAALEERYTALSEMIYKIKEINDTANIIVTERLKKIRERSGSVSTYDGHGGVRKENSAVRSTIMTNA